MASWTLLHLLSCSFPCIHSAFSVACLISVYFHYLYSPV
jgi:hypothetical protein